MSRGLLVAAGVAAALVMVGCGNDLSDSGSTTTAEESTTTSEEESTTTSEEESTTTSEGGSGGDDLVAQFESEFGLTSDQATCFADTLGADLDESGVENIASSDGPEDLSDDEALATKDAFIECLLLPQLEGEFSGADSACVADEAAAYVDEQYPDPKDFLEFITSSDTETATEFGEGMGVTILENCLGTDTSSSE